MQQPPNPDGTLCACVLAGGLSRRMGRDKALIRPFGPEGPTMLEHALDLMRPFCAESLVATSKGRPYPPWPCIFDETPGLGPISGILAALLYAQKKSHAGIFALACDLPLMRVDMLQKLANLGMGQGVGCFFIDGASNKVEMLVGIYSTRAIPYLQAGMAQKRYGIYAALPKNEMRLLPYDESERRLFLNCNSAGDLSYLAGTES